MSSKTSAARHAAWPVTLAVLAVGFALATVTRADADLWGHLRFGLDALRDKHLSSVDPYSFTQDKAWVNHEWLSELLMGVAYKIGGATGLVILKASLLTVVLAIVWAGLRGMATAPASGILVALVIGTIHMTSSMRPQLWTLAALAIVTRLLLSERWTTRFWAPLVFVVWVNSHGGWIVGLGVLGAWALVDVWRQPARWSRWSALLAVTVAATLANPYGWRLWLFMAETVRMSRDIAEWGPLWGTPVLNWIPWFAATLAVLWSLRREDAHRWHAALVLSMLAFSSARVMRIESLYVTVAAILLAPAITARWPRPVPSSTSQSLRAAATVALAACAVIAAAGVRSELRSVRCIGVWGRGTPDIVVLTSLRHAQDGRLVTFFDWGQYALWHLGPRVRVSMDGRRETVYTDARLAEHDAILKGTPAGLEALDNWRAEYVWLPSSARTTAQWLRDHGYRIDIETGQSFVAVRSDLPRLPPASSSPARYEPACFPG